MLQNLNMRFPRTLKLLRYSFYTFLFFLLLILLGNFWLLYKVQGFVFEELEQVPSCEVALVLGTSSSVNGRDENPFFSYRMEVAARLFHAGKVRHILVSGDNSTKNYNEPRDMRKALIKLGVPDSCISMDFAGLRTLDSVVRGKRVFQLKRVVLISQEFHNYRAVFLARYEGLEAYAFNAPYPASASSRMIWREYLARNKALWDVYVANTQPRFLGDPIDLPIH